MPASNKCSNPIKPTQNSPRVHNIGGRVGIGCAPRAIGNCCPRRVTLITVEQSGHISVMERPSVGGDLVALGSSRIDVVKAGHGRTCVHWGSLE